MLTSVSDGALSVLLVADGDDDEVENEAPGGV